MNVMKIEKLMIAEFKNYRFTILGCEKKDHFVITLVDMPFTNPHDWILLYGIMKKA